MAVKKTPFVIIRASQAGVFAGNLASRKGTEVVLTNSRRLWYWSGAASLSQMAVDGVSDPRNCKFPAVIEGNHTILGVCEIIPVSKKAETSIKAVPVWQK